MNEKSPLVSIIIPTYNRAKIIGETLESVLAQTYENWECIIVDDGSDDNTEEIVSNFTLKDNRFKYYKRPESLPKGANACRNFGFELSKGEFISWYDSDDIMLPNKVEAKLSFFQNFGYDFVVSKSKWFFDDCSEKKKNAPHGNTSLPLNLENFALSRIIWITDDIFFSRKTVESILWNESLKAGQEYNFICKYLSKNPKGHFIDQVLSLRRMHSNSIRGQRNDDYITNRLSFISKYQTFLELDTSKTIKKQLLIKTIKNYLQLQTYELIVNSPSLAKSIYKISNLYDVSVFYLMLISKLLLNKHQRFYKILAKRFELI